MSHLVHGAPVAAVDLGATSGRVMLGELIDGKVQLHLVHRFANGPVPLANLEDGAGPDDLAWDIDELWTQIRYGLKLAFAQRPDIASIGVDSWAVDYALLAAGERLGAVRHYRDPRNELAVPQLEAKFDRAEIFDRNGLQFLPFNTVYQLQAERAHTRLAAADTVLLVPDYFNWLLTGVARSEWTNVSTTGLLNQRTGTWDAQLSEHLGVANKLPEIIHPGEVVGRLRPELAEELGAGQSVQVVAVASHDTASAVAATPLSSARSAYVSCGTWGLVGVELQAPVLTEKARSAGFTNELGVDQSVRFLKNVTGTFLLSESIRFWNEQAAASGQAETSLEELLVQAEKLPVPPVLIDPQDERFLAPGQMPQRVGEAVRDAGGQIPATRAELIRVIIESLAASFASQAFAAAEFGGFAPQAIHIVGGGSQGELLCQRTADHAGVPVVAGPVECTALGNVLVQQRASAGSEVNLADLRELVSASVQLTTYVPQSTASLV
ncbi:rhamnulokinase family protein [Glutamicibacter sp. NPDC087344]|uniref:rhamnulokinase n=1 Tax=Glutamicibacter sp. NPDC087344 TaxID=3363994 RepID=UPI00380B0584